MFGEHKDTDFFLSRIMAVHGPDCGVVAVKLDGFEQAGMSMRPLMDYVEWPSGMRTHTQDMVYYQQWFQWYITASMGSAEEELLKNKGKQLFDGMTHKAIPPLKGPSPCLVPYYPSRQVGAYL